MTIVCWDGSTLAADREAGTAYIKCTTTSKIERVARGPYAGGLMGRAGDASVARELAEWLLDGALPGHFPAEARPGKPDSARLLVITADRRVLVFEKGPYPIEFRDTFHAIGAGTDAALAVLHLGFDARKAVQIASVVCNGCGGGVDTLSFETWPVLESSGAGAAGTCREFQGPSKHPL